MRRAAFGLAVVAVAFATSGCLPYLTPPGPAPLRYRDRVFTGVEVSRNVEYGKAVDQRGVEMILRLDVYQPRGDDDTTRPAIVWVHGGGFNSGDKLDGEIVDQAITFAKKGYVSVAINYRFYEPGCSVDRLTPGCFQAIRDGTHDGQAAVRFLRAEAATYRVDPERIAIGGSSAGAVVAMDAAYNSEDPGNSGHPGYSSKVRAAVGLSGAHFFGEMDSGDAPTLLFHGTADRAVPFAWAAAVVDDAHAAGLDSWLTAWKGAHHVPYAQHRDEIILQTANFFYWELDLAHAAG